MNPKSICKLPRVTPSFWFGIACIQLATCILAVESAPAAAARNAPESAGFLSKEVVFSSDGLPLEGTILSPPGRRLPAAVLIQGTGPLDRDETMGARKPFRDIANGLALLGIATLRFDKRSYTFFGRPETEQFTVEEEVIVDALSAISFLRKYEGIDPRRIFLIGHSLGGAMIPYIATRDSLLAGAVMLAPPARSPEVITADQTAFKMRLQGWTQAEIDSVIASVDETFAALKAGRKIGYESFLGYSTTYWHEFLRRDPLAALAETNVPILILHGLRDYQVIGDDFDLWIEALASRPDGDFAQKVYPTLDHTFAYGLPIDDLHESCLCGDNSLPRQVDRAVIDDIAQFIKER